MLPYNKSIAFNAVKMAQIVLLPKLSKASLVVDATAGNGKDTLFLAQNTPLDTKVFSFDIQDKAIFNTQKLLKEHNLLTKVEVVLDNHININKYLDGNIDALMFNLGYLPSSDHIVYTKSDTTIKALYNILPLLKKNGIITIVAYPGYEEGFKEMVDLESFLQDIEQQNFNVACFKMINQKNNPPALFVIEKLK